MVTHPFPRTERATEIAIEALSFLAADAERLSGFMSLSGIDPGELRKAAQNPGFFPAVLDFVCADEAILHAFSAQAGHSPEIIDHARQVLHGPQPDWGA